jgi:hypothetical protein
MAAAETPLGKDGSAAFTEALPAGLFLMPAIGSGKA